ncbi:unnamed protein product [Chondrus crispus]|uniref:Uncharacterized protein n=1 Tax=Chondrus crispus TaxID=2769 RepID=R7QS32_CHOCR|nr:unnamed protein product [Chondrus crispus]CDF40523.1 unnamed protein product [Chondrus crispus]|eukprot:XP_005710817.1 unnamed protein product [Chondrus crispus]
MNADGSLMGTEVAGDGYVWGVSVGDGYSNVDVEKMCSNFVDFGNTGERRSVRAGAGTTPSPAPVNGPHTPCSSLGTARKRRTEQQTAKR